MKLDPSLFARGVSERDVRAWIADFYRIAGEVVPPGELRIVCAAERGSFDPKTNRVDLGAKPTRAVLFHELGHAVEYRRPDLQGAAATWRDARAEDSGFGAQREKLSALSEGAYEAHEEAVLEGGITPPMS